MDWCSEMSLIDENGELDREKLDEICELMGKSFGEGEE